MRYGCPYKIIDFDTRALQIIKRAISNSNLKWEDGDVPEAKGRTPRKSEVTWINDNNLNQLLLEACDYVNRSCWNIKIEGVEPVQFGIYPAGGFYDWHVDQHSKKYNNIRKISMSLFLNDDYEGGDFDLEIYKPGTDPRFDTFKPKPGSAIFFQSDQWHRVRSVTSGLRKSLVAWYYGPTYT